MTAEVGLLGPRWPAASTTWSASRRCELPHRLAAGLAADLLAEPRGDDAAVSRRVGYASPFTFMPPSSAPYGHSPTAHRAPEPVSLRCHHQLSSRQPVAPRAAPPAA